MKEQISLGGGFSCCNNLAQGLCVSARHNHSHGVTTCSLHVIIVRSNLIKWT